MADQGRWFKLWCCANSDQVLSNLDIADFGRWSKLGAYIKENGVNGVLKMPMPARYLTHLLQVQDVTELLVTLARLPNIDCVTYVEKKGNEDVTFLYVTYKNWRRWQGDWSKDRVARHRAKKRNEITSSSSSPSSPSSSSSLSKRNIKSSPKKEKRRDIDTWNPTEAHILTAQEKGLHIESEERKFKNYAKNKTPAYKDLDAAFDNWLLSPYQESNKKPADKFDKNMAEISNWIGSKGRNSS